MHPAEPGPPQGIGVIAPADFTLDRELWRWVPSDVALHVTRLPTCASRMTVQVAELLHDLEAVRQATQDLLTPEPAVVAYACAAGSFVDGAAGDRVLSRTIRDAGAPAACTMSRALVDGLRLLRVNRLGIVTPYPRAMNRRLVGYLAEHGVQTVWVDGVEVLEQMWRGDTPVMDGDGAQALFIGCTNIPTYDVLASLEEFVGKPVLTANEMLMCAALRALDRPAVAWCPRESASDAPAASLTALGATTSAGPGLLLPELPAAIAPTAIPSG